jgi:hypothetical protein
MAEQDSMDRGPSGCTNAATDHRDQAAVLTLVLELHPAHLTVGELVREVGPITADFEAEDRCKRAVRDLVAAGLLHLCGDLIFPSRAALLFASLATD